MADMRRRNFVGNLLAAGAFWKFAPDAALAAQAPESPAPDPAVKRVLVMFKCHLDVGFVDTQAAIIKKYFEVLGQYLERFGKIHPGEVERRAGPNRFRYWDLKEAGTNGPLYGFSMSNGRVILRANRRETNAKRVCERDCGA